MVKVKIELVSHKITVNVVKKFKQTLVEHLFCSAGTGIENNTGIQSRIVQLGIKDKNVIKAIKYWDDNKIPYRIFIFKGTAITKCMSIDDEPVMTNCIDKHQKSHILLISENRRIIYEAYSTLCKTTKNYLCPMCGKGFGNTIKLWRHVVIHNKKKPFLTDGEIENKKNEWTESKDVKKEAMDRLQKYTNLRCGP